MHTDLKTIYRQWMEAWNGNLDLIDEIVSPDFVFHPTHEQPEQPDFNGQAGMRRMIEMSREPFSALHFTTDLGPFAEDDMVLAVGKGKVRTRVACRVPRPRRGQRFRSARSIS